MSTVKTAVDTQKKDFTTLCAAILSATKADEAAQKKHGEVAKLAAFYALQHGADLLVAQIKLKYGKPEGQAKSAMAIGQAIGAAIRLGMPRNVIEKMAEEGKASYFRQSATIAMKKAVELGYWKPEIDKLSEEAQQKLAPKEEKDVAQHSGVPIISETVDTLAALAEAVELVIRHAAELSVDQHNRLSVALNQAA